MSEPTKKRRVMIVIEDDGGDNFRFQLEGDVERLNMPQIPASHLSAAEFWGMQFFQLCNEFMQKSGEVKMKPIEKGGA